MAYQVLRSKNALQKLLDGLAAKPRKSSMFALMGILRNTLRGKVEFEALVDTWPDYSAIVLRPVDGVPSSRVFRNYHWVHVEDLTKGFKFLNTPGILPWKRAFIIEAVSKECIPLITQMCEKYSYVTPKFIECFLQMYPVHLDKDYTLPYGYYIDRLKAEHAPLVNQTWEYGGSKQTEDQIRFLIEHFDTFCAYSNKREPVAWAICQIDDSAGMAFTLPQYRGKGLALSVWQDWISSIQLQKVTPYGVIVVTNVPSQKLGDKLGCMRLPDKLYYVSCRPRPPEPHEQMDSKI